MFKFLNWKVGQCQFGKKQGIMYFMYLGYVKSFPLNLLNLCVKHSVDLVILTNVKFIISDLLALVLLLCTFVPLALILPVNIVIFKIIVEI